MFRRIDFDNKSSNKDALVDMRRTWALLSFRYAAWNDTRHLWTQALSMGSECLSTLRATGCYTCIARHARVRSHDLLDHIRMLAGTHACSRLLRVKSHCAGRRI